MKETTIYVLATDDYDGYDVLCAFAEEQDALDTAARYNAYDGTRPLLKIDTNDLDEQMRIQRAWDDALKAWREAHPAGDLWANSGPFEVRPVSFFTR